MTGYCFKCFLLTRAQFIRGKFHVKAGQLREGKNMNQNVLTTFSGKLGITSQRVLRYDVKYSRSLELKIKFVPDAIFTHNALDSTVRKLDQHQSKSLCISRYTARNLSGIQRLSMSEGFEILIEDFQLIH